MCIRDSIHPVSSDRHTASFSVKTPTTRLQSRTRHTRSPCARKNVARARKGKKRHTRDTCRDGCLAYRKKIFHRYESRPVDRPTQFREGRRSRRRRFSWSGGHAGVVGGRSRVDTRQKPYPQPRARSARERPDGTNRPDSVEARERENPSVHARAKERTRERASERYEG